MNNNTPPQSQESPCHYQRVVNLVSSKWTLLVFYELEFGTRRYSDLKKRIEGVTQKMLTQTLRLMERDGLVKRVVHPVRPSHGRISSYTVRKILNRSDEDAPPMDRGPL